MIAGHVIYKVNNLADAVKEFQEHGFRVEYGRKNNPNNALIYFSEGAYLELLESTGMPSFLKKLFSLLGKEKFANRLNVWDRAGEGILDLCLEGTEMEFKQMIQALDRKGQKLKMKRTDMKNRKLAYQVFFPFDLNYPFFMTHFSINPRPIFYTHPNGSTKITKVNYPIRDKNVKNLLSEYKKDSALVLDEKENSFLYLEFNNGMRIEGNQIIFKDPNIKQENYSSK